MAKGKGLMLIDLGKKDELAGATVCGGEALLLSGTGRGGKVVEQKISPRDQANYHGNRARRGHEIPFKLKPTGLSILNND
jgi:topoisomerase-4 subunit A